VKLAILADAHMPDCAGSAQEAALRWALDRAAEWGCHWVVAAGDMTAAGEAQAARRVAKALHESGVCWLSTPGNAELRTPEDAEESCSQLTVWDESCPIALVDTSRGMVPESERERIERRLAVRPLALVTHWPPDELPEDDRCWFAEIAARSSVELVIAGHKHFDETRVFAGKPLHLVRGLDPDKGKHDLPALALFERREGEWSRQDVGFSGADPRLWPEARKHAFLDLLGVSTMGEPVAGTREAAAHGIPVLELRAEPALACPRAELRAVVADWRRSGGRCLSVHLPNMRWETGAACVASRETHAAAVELACELGADRVTAHVPRVSVRELAQPEVRQAMLRAFAEELTPLATAYVEIGIENLHRNRGEAADEQRGFGYLPDECVAWIDELRGELPGALLGLHLDIGHARNNTPFSQNWTLGRWYATVGSHCAGYHLHQVTEKGNHQPFTTPFAPLLSLASFFWAWDAGQLAPAPMILEIRGESGCASWQRLRDFLYETTR
jgi:sugar phosphate isomerase/epimerase